MANKKIILKEDFKEKDIFNYLKKEHNNVYAISLYGHNIVFHHHSSVVDFDTRKSEILWIRTDKIREKIIKIAKRYNMSFFAPSTIINNSKAVHLSGIIREENSPKYGVCLLRIFLEDGKEFAVDINSNEHFKSFLKLKNDNTVFEFLSILADLKQEPIEGGKKLLDKYIKILNKEERLYLEMLD